MIPSENLRVVVPCFNEEKALAEFVRRLSARVARLPAYCVNSARLPTPYRLCLDH
jgi:hypothetical protein